jgi:hypothetical protein
LRPIARGEVRHESSGVSNFVKGLALFVLISCGVWVAVLWRWEVTSHDMNTRDIVVYLALLPLTVFALALMLRWAWQSAVRRQAAMAASVAAASATGAAASKSADGGADEERRHATVQLLGAYLVCAAGESAAELQEAAQAGAPRPALDPEFTDADGLPVLTARIKALDATATAELDALLEVPLSAVRANRPEWAELTPPEHVRRAFSALEQPLLQAVGALAPWADRFQPAPPSSNAARDQAPARRVRLLLGWPADWTEFEQALGLAFAAELIQAHGDAPIPQACFVFTSLAGSGEALLAHADRLLQTLTREGHQEPLIVAACHSTLSDSALEALEREGKLFSASKRPKGSMPGEAAAVLVLADAAWPRDPAADGPVPHLHRPAVLMRDKSVDAPGRVTSEVLTQSVTQALMAAQLGVDAVAAITCDADQHSARGGEFHGSAMSLGAELDTEQDMRVLGTVTGAVGAVSTLLVVACAAERAKVSEKPCLAVTLGDPFARLALVALPGPPPSTEPNAAKLTAVAA